MSVKMSKGRMVLFLIALFLSNFIVMNDYVIIPVAANLYEAFPAQTGIVNFILSGPQILGVITALICGKLEKVSKKLIIIVAFGIFAISGIFGVAVESALHIAVMRAIMGACMGFVNTAAVALLAEVFVDEKLRSTYMGIFNAAMAGVGAVMSYAAGMLAIQSWESVFKVYWASVPILILFILFLPKTTAAEGADSDAAVQDEGTNNNLGAKYWVFIVSLFVFVITYMVLSYMVSVYIRENNLGDASLAGLCTSLSTILSAIMCTIFGFTYGKLKRWVVVPSWIIFALFYFLMFLHPSKGIAIAASALMGGAFGNGFSYYYTDGTIIVPRSKITLSVGIITALQGLAMGLASYFSTALMNVLGTDKLTPTFLILGIISVIGAIYAVIFALSNRKE